jgi:hypothetical protein
VKPLNKHSSKQLLQRIDNAANGELRSITVIGPTTMQLRLSVQDTGRGYDWIDILFEIDGLGDARLLDDAKLPFVDMGEGISLLFEGEKVGMGVGSYDSIAALCDSVLYVVGSGVKFAEADFSG